MGDHPVICRTNGLVSAWSSDRACDKLGETGGAGVGLCVILDAAYAAAGWVMMCDVSDVLWSGLWSGRLDTASRG